MKDDLVELRKRLETAERGLHVAMVASCDCDHEANISPKPDEAHSDECLYRVLYVAADALADVRTGIESLQSDLLRMREALEEARAAIWSLKPDALGMGQIAFGETGVDLYSIRDRVLAVIESALTPQERGE